MPEEELEALAARVYAAYAALPEADGRQVDPLLLAGRLLGLRVVYRRLSGDGSILGVTSPGAVAVPVWAEGGPAWFFLDGRTVLLDEGLRSPWVPEGRRRFTLMHELSHLLLAAAPEGAGKPCFHRPESRRSPEERRADRLASALLMPKPLVLRGMRACGLPSGPAPDRKLDPEGWRRFAALAEILGVSRQALSIRLRFLAPPRPAWALGPALRLAPEGAEEARLEE